MIRHSESLEIAQCFLTMTCCLWVAPVFAQKPQFIGRTSCATATCHGGLIGDGPVWHSAASRWESSDPHRAAGNSLLTNLSRKIVAGIESKSSQDSALFAKVLRERCVSCHAPEAISSSSDAERVSDLRNQLSRGVGCESCHGPASVWEELHTQLDWSDMKRFDKSVGMRETESLLARVDNCSRCHVGSRTEDNSIRDMNHDMIAAGHPALVFDMYRYENGLPPHWNSSRAAFNPNSPSKVVSGAAAARARVLFSTAKLSTERADATVPQPELSEFDCTACHHQLSPSSRINNSVSSGFPSWNAWLTVGNSLNFSTDMLRINHFEMPNQVSMLQKESERRSLQLLSVEEADPLAFLKSSLAAVLTDKRVRSQVTLDGVHVQAWFDQLEIAAYAASSQLTENRRNRVNAILDSFRSQKLGANPRQPIWGRNLFRVDYNAEDVGNLCKEIIEVIDAESVRKIE